MVHAPVGVAADEQFLQYVVPVGTSGFAIAAGYLGLFSILIFPAPFALGFGALAARDLRRHPAKRGWVRTGLGLVLGGLGSVLLLFLLGGAFVDSFGGG
jgi:hypothetical protein